MEYFDSEKVQLFLNNKKRFITIMGCVFLTCFVFCILLGVMVEWRLMMKQRSFVLETSTPSNETFAFFSTHCRRGIPSPTKNETHILFYCKDGAFDVYAEFVFVLFSSLSVGSCGGILVTIGHLFMDYQFFKKES